MSLLGSIIPMLTLWELPQEGASLFTCRHALVPIFSQYLSPLCFILIAFPQKIDPLFSVRVEAGGSHFVAHIGIGIWVSNSLIYIVSAPHCTPSNSQAHLVFCRANQLPSLHHAPPWALEFHLVLVTLISTF